MNKVFENSIRVRYAETDQMGFVYYGNYPQYLEVARTELIRDAGLTYKELEAAGIHLPVVHLDIAYRHPAKYDDLLVLKTKIVGEINKKITFSTEIFNENEQLVCAAKVELIFVNSKTGKVMTCPEDVNQKLTYYK